MPINQEKGRSSIAHAWSRDKDDDGRSLGSASGGGAWPASDRLALSMSRGARRVGEQDRDRDRKGKSRAVHTLEPVALLTLSYLQIDMHAGAAS